MDAVLVGIRPGSNMRSGSQSRYETRVRPRDKAPEKSTWVSIFIGPQRAMRCSKLEIKARASDRGSSCDERADKEQAEWPRDPSTIWGDMD